MIQVLGLRKFVPKGEEKEKTYDKLFDVPKVNSVKNLFENYEAILAAIPTSEHFNLFYTIANCKEGKREFDFSNCIAFDIDGISDKYLEDYGPTILKALGIDKGPGVVASGNGVHVLVYTKQTIKDKNYYKENKGHYKALCARIDRALAEEGLPGKSDSSVFEPRRILRLPGTVNRKPDKPEKNCRLLSPITAQIDFDITKASGLPKVDKKEQLSQATLRRYPNVDPPAVMDGCSFLRFCKENPNDIDEPQWYAALSVTSRLSNKDHDGVELSHELSRGYRGYDPDETDEKISQAQEASGPRTCDSIGKLWDGCNDCPYFGKLSSPILIRGKDCIATEFTGFHTILRDSKGNEKLIPNYQDLRQFFEREHQYKGLYDSGIVMVWDKTHYRPYGKNYLNQFAQEHFDPPAKDTMRREFTNLVNCTNLKDRDWWVDGTRGKINFKNGYLDFDTMDFLPHDASLPFRYVLPYEYDAQAKAPNFMRMLSLVTGGDQKVMDLLLEFMGYSLSNNDCWAQKVLVLIGDGANGKSTFINVLTDLAGEGNYSSVNMEDLNKSEYSRQLLDGKLFNISEETPTKALLNNSLFKSLATGGEVQVRQIYKDPYSIRNSAKLIFTCNELPGSPDLSYGFYRRLLIVPFKYTFKKKDPTYDPHIADKLKKELPGIFNLALAGYQRLVKNQGFTECDSVEDEVSRYEEENNSILRWIKDHMVVHTNGGFETNFAPIKDLYDSYKKETEFQSERPVSFIKFSKFLQKWLPEYDRRYQRKRFERGDKVSMVRGLQGVSYEL